MNKNGIIRLLRHGFGVMLLAAVLLSGSCMKRDLDMRTSGTDGYAEITLDWGSDTRPQSARYLFYDESGKLVKEVKGLTDGFKGALAAGKYHLVAHNEDARQVDYRGTDSYQSAEVFARMTDYTEENYPSAGLPCIMEPQFVFGAGTCKESDEIIIRQHDTTRMTVVPVSLTKLVRFHFTVNGIEAMSSLKGVMNGVSSSVFFSSGKCNASNPLSAVQFTAAPQSKAAAGDYVAEIGVFDLPTTSESPEGTNTIDMILTDVAQNTHKATFELTEALKQIIRENGGVIPVDIPIEVIIEVKPLGELTGTVKPWDDSGTGSGDPRPTHESHSNTDK